MFWKFLIICNFFLINYAKGHAPPNGTNNSNYLASSLWYSHQGMGRIAKDEYEAAAILRERCTQSILDNNKALVCKQNKKSLEKANISSDQFIYNLSEINTKLYLREYAAKVLRDEYQSNYGNSKELKKIPRLKCIPPPTQAPVFCSRFIKTNCISRDKAPTKPTYTVPEESPHKGIRAISHDAINMVYAAIVDQIYGGHNFGLIDSIELDYRHDDYVTRLSRAVPQLFNPTNRSAKLIEIIEKKLGSEWAPNIHFYESHNSMIKAFTSMYTSDTEFKKEIDDAIIQIEQKYSEAIFPQISSNSSSTSICNQGPEEIFQNHPGIFDQAIIDMDPAQRAMANIYLCKQDFYYDSNDFDTDCDGISDNDDPNPDDPYIPKSSFHKEGDAMQDPPYSSRYDYKVSRTDSEIVLDLELGFNTKGITDPQRETFFKDLALCQKDFEKSILDTYQKLRQKQPWLEGRELKLNFNFKEGNDLTVHKCFCSDCRVEDPESLFGLRIPKNKCWDELSDKQKAVTSKDEWRDRANASNLTVNNNCRTMKHEIMHRMGLPDEYTNTSSYLYNRTNDFNLMGSSKEEIFPRHIEEILRPKMCTGRQNSDYDLAREEKIEEELDRQEGIEYVWD